MLPDSDAAGDGLTDLAGSNDNDDVLHVCLYSVVKPWNLSSGTRMVRDELSRFDRCGEARTALFDSECLRISAAGKQ
jgi:hypothetical protein